MERQDDQVVELSANGEALPPPSTVDEKVPSAVGGLWGSFPSGGSWLAGSGYKIVMIGLAAVAVLVLYWLFSPSQHTVARAATVVPTPNGMTSVADDSTSTNVDDGDAAAIDAEARSRLRGTHVAKMVDRQSTSSSDTGSDLPADIACDVSAPGTKCDPNPSPSPSLAPVATAAPVGGTVPDIPRTVPGYDPLPTPSLSPAQLARLRQIEADTNARQAPLRVADAGHPTASPLPPSPPPTTPVPMTTDQISAQTQRSAYVAMSSQADDFTLHAQRTPEVTRFAVLEGTYVPIMLDGALNSQLPGPFKAHVTRSVMDSRMNQFVEIPKNTVIIGQYNSQVLGGQTKLQVVLTRLIFPDGSSLALHNMQAMDTDGSAGLSAAVNDHHTQIFTATFLTAVLSAGAQLAQPPGTLNALGTVTPTTGQIAASAAGNSVAQTGSQMIQGAIAQSPTLVVPAGREALLYLDHDIPFQAPYAPYAP